MQNFIFNVKQFNNLIGGNKETIQSLHNYNFITPKDSKFFELVKLNKITTVKNLLDAGIKKALIIYNNNLIGFDGFEFVSVDFRFYCNDRLSRKADIKKYIADCNRKNEFPFVYIMNEKETLFYNHYYYNNIYSVNKESKSYIQRICEKRRDELKQKALQIRFQKMQEQKQRDRETTEGFKQKILPIINKKISAMFEIESLKIDDSFELTNKLMQFKKRILQASIIKTEIQNLLLNNDIMQEFETVCETTNKTHTTTYKTTFKKCLYDYFLEGCYSLMLQNFSACNQGLDWYDNTFNFNIINSDLKESNVLKYSL